MAYDSPAPPFRNRNLYLREQMVAHPQGRQGAEELYGRNPRPHTRGKNQVGNFTLPEVGHTYCKTCGKRYRKNRKTSAGHSDCGREYGKCGSGKAGEGFAYACDHRGRRAYDRIPRHGYRYDQGFLQYVHSRQQYRHSPAFGRYL